MTKLAITIGKTNTKKKKKKSPQVGDFIFPQKLSSRTFRSLTNQKKLEICHDKSIDQLREKPYGIVMLEPPHSTAIPSPHRVILTGILTRLFIGPTVGNSGMIHHVGFNLSLRVC